MPPQAGSLQRMINSSEASRVTVRQARCECAAPSRSESGKCSPTCESMRDVMASAPKPSHGSMENAARWRHMLVMAKADVKSKARMGQEQQMPAQHDNKLVVG